MIICLWRSIRWPSLSLLSSWLEWAVGWKLTGERFFFIWTHTCILEKYTVAEACSSVCLPRIEEHTRVTFRCPPLLRANERLIMALVVHIDWSNSHLSEQPGKAAFIRLTCTHGLSFCVFNPVTLSNQPCQALLYKWMFMKIKWKRIEWWNSGIWIVLPLWSNTYSFHFAT